MGSRINSIFALLLLLTALLCFSACPGTDNDIGKPSTNEVQIIDHTMNVHKFYSEKMPQGKVTVSGQAQNISNHTLATAVIYARFYDKDGKFIYQSSALKENMQAGEIWYFTIEGTGPDIWKITTYDISTGTK
jgi:hypothetical protein